MQRHHHHGHSQHQQHKRASADNEPIPFFSGPPSGPQQQNQRDPFAFAPSASSATSLHPSTTLMNSQQNFQSRQSAAGDASSLFGGNPSRGYEGAADPFASPVQHYQPPRSTPVSHAGSRKPSATQLLFNSNPTTKPPLSRGPSAADVNNTSTSFFDDFGLGPAEAAVSPGPTKSNKIMDVFDFGGNNRPAAAPSSSATSSGNRGTVPPLPFNAQVNVKNSSQLANGVNTNRTTNPSAVGQRKASVTGPSYALPGHPAALGKTASFTEGPRTPPEPLLGESASFTNGPSATQTSLPPLAQVANVGVGYFTQNGRQENVVSRLEKPQETEVTKPANAATTQQPSLPTRQESSAHILPPQSPAIAPPPTAPEQVSKPPPNATFQASVPNLGTMPNGIQQLPKRDDSHEISASAPVPAPHQPKVTPAVVKPPAVPDANVLKAPSSKPVGGVTPELRTSPSTRNFKATSLFTSVWNDPTSTSYQKPATGGASSVIGKPSKSPLPSQHAHSHPTPQSVDMKTSSSTNGQMNGNRVNTFDHTLGNALGQISNGSANLETNGEVAENSAASDQPSWNENLGDPQHLENDHDFSRVPQDANANANLNQVFGHAGEEVNDVSAGYDHASWAVNGQVAETPATLEGNNASAEYDALAQSQQASYDFGELQHKGNDNEISLDGQAGYDFGELQHKGNEIDISLDGQAGYDFGELQHKGNDNDISLDGQAGYDFGELQHKGNDNEISLDGQAGYDFGELQHKGNDNDISLDGHAGYDFGELQHKGNDNEISLDGQAGYDFGELQHKGNDNDISLDGHAGYDFGELQHKGNDNEISLDGQAGYDFGELQHKGNDNEISLDDLPLSNYVAGTEGSHPYDGGQADADEAANATAEAGAHLFAADQGAGGHSDDQQFFGQYEGAQDLTNQYLGYDASQLQQPGYGGYNGQYGTSQLQQPQQCYEDYNGEGVVQQTQDQTDAYASQNGFETYDGFTGNADAYKAQEMYHDTQNVAYQNYDSTQQSREYASETDVGDAGTSVQQDGYAPDPYATSSIADDQHNFYANHGYDASVDAAQHQHYAPDQLGTENPNITQSYDQSAEHHGNGFYGEQYGSNDGVLDPAAAFSGQDYASPGYETHNVGDIVQQNGQEHTAYQAQAVTDMPSTSSLGQPGGILDYSQPDTLQSKGSTDLKASGSNEGLSYPMSPDFDQRSSVSVNSSASNMVDYIVCPKCGKKSDSESNFCGKCGTNISGLPVVNGRTTAEPVTQAFRHYGSEVPGRGLNQAVRTATPAAENVLPPTPPALNRMQTAPPTTVNNMYRSAVPKRTKTPVYAPPMSNGAPGAYTAGTEPYQAGRASPGPQYHTHQMPAEPPAFEDPLGRHRGHCIAVFGAGGKLFVTGPKRQTRYVTDMQGRPSMVEKTYPDTVSVTPIQKLINPAVLQEYQKTPGPLVGGKAKPKKKDVLKMVEQLISSAEMERDVAQENLSLKSRDGGVLSDEEKDVVAEKSDAVLTAQLLKHFVENDGVPYSASGVKSEQTTQQLIAILRPSGASSAAGSTVDQIQNALLASDRDGAVKIAVAAGLWAYALIIASNVNKDVYRDVVLQFSNSEFGEGHVVDQPASGPKNDKSAMRVIFGLFGGMGAGVINEYLPEAGAMSGPVTSEQLNNWREILGMILANRTPGDLTVIGMLGDRLKMYNKRSAAEFCYLIASLPNSIGGVDTPNVRTVLLGADHVNYPSSFFRSSTILHKTEIYEYSQTLYNGAGISNTLPHLQAYKVYHASLLADLGLTEEATKYCDSVESVVKQYARGSPYFHRTFGEALGSLINQLAAAKGGAAPNASGKESSGWLSKLGSLGARGVEKLMNNALGEGVAAPNRIATPQPDGRLTPGPGSAPLHGSTGLTHGHVPPMDRPASTPLVSSLGPSGPNRTASASPFAAGFQNGGYQQTSVSSYGQYGGTEGYGTYPAEAATDGSQAYTADAAGQYSTGQETFGEYGAGYGYEAQTQSYGQPAQGQSWDGYGQEGYQQDAHAYAQQQAGYGEQLPEVGFEGQSAGYDQQQPYDPNAYQDPNQDQQYGQRYEGYAAGDGVVGYDSYGAGADGQQAQGFESTEGDYQSGDAQAGYQTAEYPQQYGYAEGGDDQYGQYGQPDAANVDSTQYGYGDAADQYGQGDQPQGGYADLGRNRFDDANAHGFDQQQPGQGFGDGDQGFGSDEVAALGAETNEQSGWKSGSYFADSSYAAANGQATDTATQPAPPPPAHKSTFGGDLAEEDDPLGLGNRSSVANVDRPKQTDDKAPTSGTAETAKAEADDKNAAASAAQSKGLFSAFGSLFGGRKKEKDDKDAGPGPVKANLGEKSAFYYDEKLKKWVNKKGGAEEEKKTELAPPPMGSSMSAPVSRNATPSLAQDPAGSATASPAMDTPPVFGASLGAKRRGGRNRYVDVLNPDSGKTSPVTSMSFIPPPAAVGVATAQPAKILKPGPSRQTSFANFRDVQQQQVTAGARDSTASATGNRPASPYAQRPPQVPVAGGAGRNNSPGPSLGPDARRAPGPNAANSSSRHPGRPSGMPPVPTQQQKPRVPDHTANNGSRRPSDTDRRYGALSPKAVHGGATQKQGAPPADF